MKILGSNPAKIAIGTIGTLGAAKYIGGPLLKRKAEEEWEREQKRRKQRQRRRRKRR